MSVPVRMEDGGMKQMKCLQATRWMRDQWNFKTRRHFSSKLSVLDWTQKRLPGFAKPYPSCAEPHHQNHSLLGLEMLFPGYVMRSSFLFILQVLLHIRKG